MMTHNQVVAFIHSFDEHILDEDFDAPEDDFADVFVASCITHSQPHILAEYDQCPTI